MRWHAGTAVAPLLFLGGCAAVWGFQDLTSGSDGGTGSSDATVGDDGPDGATEEDVMEDESNDAPSDGSLDGATDAEGSASARSDAVSTDDAPPYDAGICATTTVDAVHGVFVAPGGTNGAGCGTTTSSPCQSITAGIATAATATGGVARNIVYVSAGVYTEKITLVGGVTVRGGWHASGATWTFDCGPAPESQVIVQAPPTSNGTVVANGNDGMTATLSTLTVLSKAAANPGESLYGIFATGANTLLALTDVVVTMQAGGAGQAGTIGAPGVAPPASCSVSDGTTNADGNVGTAGTVGTFSSTGFTARTGATGGAGAAGDNGTSGGPGMSASVSVCGPDPCTNGQANCVGGAGANGCGGGGGLGGSGGTGGGSSVAIFAYDATVTVIAGGLQAGNGGSGGAGGAGGAGAAGSSGATGVPSVCAQSACSDSGALSCTPLGMDVTGPGGLAGGPGGQGGAGGQGGGGAGGDSYVIVTGGMATSRLALLASPALTPGVPGPGGSSNGPSGTAGAQNTF
jgi:hypothetical protein